MVWLHISAFNQIFWRVKSQKQADGSVRIAANEVCVFMQNSSDNKEKKNEEI